MRVDDPLPPRDEASPGDARFPRLNLPAYEPRFRGEGEDVHIYDPIRSQYVHLTPEEWVRQHFLRYLTHHCGYPASLTAVEKGFRFQRMMRRADIVVHDRTGRPFLMVECKAPNVPISQATFDQVSRYNRAVASRYLGVTNGMVHYCWTVDSETGRHAFLDEPPAFERASVTAPSPST